MAGMFRTYQRNYSASDTTSAHIDYAGDPTASIEETGWEAPTGYEFSEWNSSQDGSGTAYQVGEIAYEETLYAIWTNISVPYLVNDTDLTAIADAIRAKGGTSAPLVYPTGFVSAIEAIETGGGGSSASLSDVNFYDYDGTLVTSYTAAEFAALDALPANPSHDNLTAQGWNWTLTNAKTYVASYGKLNIGQMYTTNDGKTRIYIHLEEGRLSPMLGVCPNGTVTVDWGDGSATTTLTGTNTLTVKWTSVHTYPEAGDYVITLMVSGSMGLSGFSNSGNGGSYLLRYSSATDNRNYVYRNAIQKVEIGSNVTSINDNAFSHCYGLRSITIPSSVTTIGGYVFYACYGLRSVTIPSSVTTIGGYALYNCYGLRSVTFPSSMTSIGTYAFYNCYGLQSMAIPSSVTSIGSYAFYNCHGLRSITIPPGVASADSMVFANCQGLSFATISSGITSIGTYAFYYDYGLSSITIPSSVTSIGNYAFNYCSSLSFIRFKSTTPPTVSGGKAWTGIPTDCVIYVPSGSLSAYTSATNYPSSSTYTYVEE